MSAGEIQERFGCSWPTTSRHLKVLLDAGLVDVRKDGRERHYLLNQERVRSVAGAWLDHLSGPSVSSFLPETDPWYS